MPPRVPQNQKPPEAPLQKQPSATALPSRLAEAVEQCKAATLKKSTALKKSAAISRQGSAVESDSGDVEQLFLPFGEVPHVHPLPNAFIRSALFPARDQKQARPMLDNQRIFSLGEFEVFFTGPRFDQGDLDVLAAIFARGRPVALGSEFRFVAHEVLRELGKQPGGLEYKWLRDAVLRLSAGQIQFRSNRRVFWGSIIEGGVGEHTSDYVVRLNPKLSSLFGYDMWSQVDREQRRALGRNGTAKALHCYYSSHAEPHPHKYETLAGLTGLSSPHLDRLKRTLIRAHEALAHPKCGFLADFNAGRETIQVTRAHVTPSQARHLARRRTRLSARPTTKNR